MSVKYDLYVDGSAIGNINVDANTPTGWSMVCVNKNNESMVNEIYGRVATDPNLEHYIGAEVGSNNTCGNNCVIRSVIVYRARAPLKHRCRELYHIW